MINMQNMLKLKISKVFLKEYDGNIQDNNLVMEVKKESLYFLYNKCF